MSFSRRSFLAHSALAAGGTFAGGFTSISAQSASSPEAPADALSATLAEIYRYPKIELHIHLEATLPMPVYLELARKYDVELPRPPELMEVTRTFKEFFGLLRFTSTLLRSPEDLQMAAYNYAVFAAASGQVYAEVIINPQHWPHWGLEPLMDHLCTGFERAAREGYTDCRLLISLMRYQSREDALALVDHLIAERPERVVGLSIDGDERAAGRTGERFRPAFLKAKENGLHTVAHAGETSGPEGVRDAIQLLEVDRIDHGVRAIEDPATVALAAETQTPFNITLTSNVGWLAPTYREHPFARLRQAGVPITLNTDHPGKMKTDLNQEFMHAALAANWGRAEFRAITEIALEASFCDVATKARLRTAIEAGYARLSPEG